MLFVSGTEIPKRLAQHENVVRSAKKVGVKHIIYTSFERRNETATSPIWNIAQSHLQTEKLLKESGLIYTILKNNLYMDFIPAFAGEKVLETGTIYLPAGKGKASVALRSEFAEATAIILSSSGHENKMYDFTNIEAYSFNEIAEYISDITGKTISYVSPTAEEYTQTLIKAGVPSEAAAIYTGFAVAVAQNDLDIVSNDLEKLLGGNQHLYTIF